jgi:hypothetical protein
VRVNCSQTVDEIVEAAAWISHGTFHNILSDDLNMSPVTQHSVQLDDRMNIFRDLIESADKDGKFLNLIITGDERRLFRWRMWICVSVCELPCNMVSQNHSPRN